MLVACPDAEHSLENGMQGLIAAGEDDGFFSFARIGHGQPRWRNEKTRQRETDGPSLGRKRPKRRAA